MKQKQCVICRWFTAKGEKLCKIHKKVYLYDSTIKGYRLKKRNNGSSTSYIKRKYHKHETQLVKMLESFYGPRNVVTGYHPLWAKSKKGALLEYDVLIKNKDILIEYNGEQHYKFTPLFHKNKTRFEEQRRRDRRKANFAKEKGLSLVIIRYDEPFVKDYIINKIEKGLK